MRLVTRLGLSHAALAWTLVAALAAILAALSAIRTQVREVLERDLATIDEEEEIYRAAWAVEVSARHALDACELGATKPGVETNVVAARDALVEKLKTKGPAASPLIRDAVAPYLQLGNELIAGDTCALLRTAEARKRRLQQDEHLTDAWIARLYQLHRALEAKEDMIARAGTRALLGGAAASALALLAAFGLSTWIARGVSRPLGTLAHAAHRVGRGDFSPIPLGGGPDEVRQLARDLDLMREHLAEIDALKQQFLASVSHELRTPLGKMREALALLADGTAGPLDDRQRSVVAIARRACEAEIRLVTTLLDLSRLRAGTLLHPADQQSLDTALHLAIDTEKADAASRQVRLDLVTEGTVPPARLDEALLERAIANLVRNAVSVSTDGGVVEVRRTVEEAGPAGETGRWACIRVRDHGPGIPEEIRDHLFDPFTTREVAGRRGVGIGLGLALAREVVRGHGGSLILTETSSQGTTFALWIPL